MSDEHARRTTHEFAREARDMGPVTIELDEGDLFALQNGKTVAEVLKTEGSPFDEVNDDTSVHYLKIKWQMEGSIGGKGIREVSPDVFEGVLDDER